jgi:hypothetical protein
VVEHIVLFKPRAGLTDAQRQTLAATMKEAIRDIPHLRRARFGHRVFTGRPYEQMMRADYPFVAILEFDDHAALKAYMVHPVHERLGEVFFECFEDALMYDYALDEGEAAIDALMSSTS